MNDQAWKISRNRGNCAACNRAFAHGEEHMTAIMEAPPQEPQQVPETTTSSGNDEDEGAAYVRMDFCGVCWPASSRPEWLAHWRTCWDPPSSGKRKFNRQTAMDIFRRTGLEAPEDAGIEPAGTNERPESQRGEASTHESQKVRLRYVLALMLMRKKMLKFVAARDDNGRETLVLRDGEDTEHLVAVPPIAPDEADALTEEIARAMGW